eukprot:7336698-Alexandrium_andersonii.AAC.1
MCIRDRARAVQAPSARSSSACSAAPAPSACYFGVTAERCAVEGRLRQRWAVSGALRRFQPLPESA